MNFSESTFILPPSTRDSHAQLRIFSTTKEMPMAGHPVVGTALVLYELQRMGAGRYIFDLAVGPVEVFVEVEKTVPNDLDESRIGEFLGLCGPTVKD